MSAITKFIAYLRSLPKLYTIPATVLILAGAAIGVHVMTRPASAPDAPASLSYVQVASVASLSSQGGALPLTGAVTSLNKAAILSQSSGEVISLRHSIGDYVGAGEIIGQFENSAQRAAVLQAQGSYDAAAVALAKVSGTTAQNSSITSAQADSSAKDAVTSATTALKSAYGALDDAVHAKTDPFFGSPRSSSPKFLSYTIPDSQLVLDIENGRSTLEAVLADAQTIAGVTASTDVDGDISAMTAHARTILAFIDNVVQAMNQAVPNPTFTAATIATNQTTAAAARSEVVAAISSLTTAKSAYGAAVSSAATAANSATSGSQSDIAAAQASLKTAEGALNAAKAALEKTIIRSSISGVIVSLPITRGDYVSAFSPVAQVSNPNALYVESFVTSDDAKTLAVGDKASIGDSAAGAITFVAPAIDPTNGKVEVKIGITSGEGSLTDGEVVTVSIERKQHVSAAASVTTLPLASLKMTPQGPVVFSIGTTSALVAHGVTLGATLGGRVVIESGLTPDMQIVTDARGLSEGQTVAVDVQ